MQTPCYACYLVLYMQSTLIIWCFVYKVSLLFNITGISVPPAPHQVTAWTAAVLSLHLRCHGTHDGTQRRAYPDSGALAPESGLPASAPAPVFVLRNPQNTCSRPKYVYCWHYWGARLYYCVRASPCVQHSRLARAGLGPAPAVSTRHSRLQDSPGAKAQDTGSGRKIPAQWHGTGACHRDLIPDS